MVISNRVVKLLLLISSIAGILAVFLFRRNLAAEATMVSYLGYLTEDIINSGLTLETVDEVFFKPIVGFIFLDFFDIVNVFLVSILFLSVLLFTGIKNRLSTTIGTILLLSCFTLYIVSNRAILIYCNLGNTEALEEIINQRSYDISLFLLYLFGLYITIIIKNNSNFSKYTYILGLLTNIIGLTYFPLSLISNDINYFAIVLAAPFTVIWHFNISINLNRLRKKYEE